MPFRSQEPRQELARAEKLISSMTWRLLTRTLKALHGESNHT